MKNIFSLIILIFCASCAHKYQGSGPNLNLKGPAAVEEYHRFKMESIPGFSVRLGRDQTRYTVDSVLPFVKEVSPEANQKFETAKNWRRAQEISLLIGVFGLAGYLIDSRNDFYKGMAYGGSIVSLGFGFVWDLDGGIKIYNDDLKNKLRSSD